MKEAKENLNFPCYIQKQMAQVLTAEETLQSLGLVLPQLPAPGGNYLSAKRVGEIV